jgi:hypothetical protein
MTKQPTFSINPFYRRQTTESKFSHFDGTDEQLLKEVEQNFPLRREGKRNGAYIVPISPVVENARCYTPVVPVHRHSFLNTEVVAKAHGTPLICASLIGKKRAAEFAEVVIYERTQLVRIGEASGGADYEVVSLHASDVERQPSHPYEIARQVLNEGAKYDSHEICEAIIYWGTHAFVKPKFVQHAHVEVAKPLRKGDMTAAYQARRRLVPDELEEDSRGYIQALHSFMCETNTLYV